MSALAAATCCRDFVELVTDYSERTLPMDRREELEEHLLVCPPCYSYKRQLDQTTRLLARLGTARNSGSQTQPPSPIREDSAEREYALKFLASDRLAPFTRARWPAPDEGDRWISGDRGPGFAAVYACTIAQAPYWLNDELWIVELAGEIERMPRKMSGRRGRLVAPVTAWSEQAREEFADSCVKTALAATVETLRGEGRDDEAAELEQRLPDEALTKEAADLAEEDALGRALRWAWAYLSAALEYRELPATVAFVAAAAADHARGPDGAASERRRQADWLDDKLGLADLLVRASSPA